jgi:hypothetical protein
MSVQETSKIAFEKLKDSPTTQKIFEAILDIGPTHNNRILEYLNQKESFKPRGQRRKWQINQVCGRVHDLIHLHSVVRDLGPHKGRWHGKPKTYHLWIVAGDVRKPVGWRPVPKDGLPNPTIPPAVIKSGLKEVQSSAEKPILQKLLFA